METDAQMKRKKYINDLVEMEMECDVQDRVGTTIEKVREYFEDLDYDELEICWLDSPYCQFYLKEEEITIEEQAEAENVSEETIREYE